MDATNVERMRATSKRLADALDTFDPMAMCLMAVAVVDCVPEPYFSAVLASVEATAEKLERYKRLHKR